MIYDIPPDADRYATVKCLHYIPTAIVVHFPYTAIVCNDGKINKLDGPLPSPWPQHYQQEETPFDTVKGHI
ncbi:hypothetical protein E2562_004807 [Oryza meyeriana var. granulata]|uniref:Uncharacterized protein n=1 Tax=Oryza meyeriana var. granulata TaxID=110450 RepID=A0A6G1DEK3_9ORYZ|nr:hypothetical protein E2562_004807 [Oryza meyeriana var. granulata]